MLSLFVCLELVFKFKIVFISTSDNLYFNYKELVNNPQYPYRVCVWYVRPEGQATSSYQENTDQVPITLTNIERPEDRGIIFSILLCPKYATIYICSCTTEFSEKSNSFYS